jgi:hypothetical protein
MFPQAKFVHIHRDPYAVFQSSQRTFDISLDHHRLQCRVPGDVDDWILRTYRTMYDVFFEERGLIPAGHYHEVCFEELERDPVGQMRTVYEALDLPSFATVEPALRDYVSSVAGYQKNEYPALPDDLRGQIARRWQPSFQEWGYST